LTVSKRGNGSPFLLQGGKKFGGKKNSFLSENLQRKRHPPVGKGRWTTGRKKKSAEKGEGFLLPRRVDRDGGGMFLTCSTGNGKIQRGENRGSTLLYAKKKATCKKGGDSLLKRVEDFALRKGILSGKGEGGILIFSKRGT